jgi:hypothetical protein
VTVAINADLKFGVRAAANSTSKSGLIDLNMSRTMNGHTNTYDTILPNLSVLNLDLLTKANPAVGNETFTFTVKDKNGQSSGVTLQVTTVPTSRPVSIAVSANSMTVTGFRKDE